MRRFAVLVKTVVFILLLFAVRYVNDQHAFQRALSDSQISFSSFPLSYTEALNASRSSGDALLDFDYASVFPVSKIPRRIHFIWFQDLYSSHTALTLNSHAPDLCRYYNPTYDIQIWNTTDASEFIKTEYPWFLSTYNDYRYPIQRIDALKYFILYHFGGVYMDLDIACRRPLEPLLQFPSWFPEASPLGVNNDLMASVQGHPVLLEMTNALIERNQNWVFPYLTIFCSTGPQFASDLLRTWYNRHAPRISGPRFHTDGYDIADVYVLPRIFYSEEYTFFGHSPGGTWHEGDVFVVLWLVDRPWALISLFTSLVLAVISIRRARCYSNNIKQMHRSLA